MNRKKNKIMKMEKRHWVIIGIIAAVVIIAWCFLIKKKKSESNYKTKLPNPQSGPATNIKCPDGWVWTGPSTGCVHKDVLKSSENSFRGGRHHGGGRFFHGGRGWGWGGYPYPYPYPYYDEPIVIGSTKCPEGWIWMGAMLGCQKPQGM